LSVESECVENFADIADNVRMSEAPAQRCPRRETIATRIDPGALEVIEKLAEQRRTSVSQVARTIIEDVARSISENAA
jgi:hypothetical protein